MLLHKMSEGEDNDVQVENNGSFRKRIRRVLGAPFRRLKQLFRKKVMVKDEEEEEEESVETSSAVSSEETTTESEKLDSSSSAEEVVVTESPSSLSPTTSTLVSSAATETTASTKTTTTTTDKRQQLFVGDRWAMSAPDVDLSGKWNLIVTDQFKEEYDKYLTLLGQPLLVRSIALSIVGMTSEETEQADENLFIRGQNVRGTWERTLKASGTTNDGAADFTPNITSIVTADGEQVEAEAWWEEQGTVHRSWLRGVERYGGGAFESKRYLDNDGKVLVCESIFHPNDTTRENAKVTWRFLKEGETL